MICQLENKQLSNIHCYLNNNGLKSEPEKFIAISNCDVQSCLEKYENVRSSDEDCIGQFASNAGGMTSYHYLKLDSVLYILQAWMGDIEQMYTVSDKWVNYHKMLLENL